MTPCDWCVELTPVPSLYWGELLCPRCHTWALRLDDLPADELLLELECMEHAMARTQRRLRRELAGRHKA